ncbi:MAG: flagellar biosynthesis anti-sigma factor FlgM [Planctomycetaceae bacterium]|jgi:flagellar biosynthesis anti-sigma factor FlgM|nr:flagellar biosynthesis anti-sigma factor FlgM [Planctomycetaceae bacterium]
MPDIGNLGNIGSSYGAGYTAGVRSTSDATTRRSVNQTSSSRATGDTVQVSEVARWLEEMDRLPAIREDKVAAAKAAIAAGTLDSDEKLAIAIERMIDDIG